MGTRAAHLEVERCRALAVRGQRDIENLLDTRCARKREPLSIHQPADRKGQQMAHAAQMACCERIHCMPERAADLDVSWKNLSGPLDRSAPSSSPISAGDRANT